jgi:hypothetical protein
MPNVVIQPKPGHVNVTGAFFWVYANRYREATLACLSRSRPAEGFDPVPYFLSCLSLELHLKSFIWLHDQIGWKKIRNKYEHDIEKLWRHAKSRGIDKFAKPTPLRDQIIALVGPYYKERQFHYLDVNMVGSGFWNIQSEPRALPTLQRLNAQLHKSLRKPILSAS